MCHDCLLAQSLEECQHHLHGGFTDKASWNSRLEPESWRTPRIRTGKRAALQRSFGWWEQNEQNPRVRNPQWELCRAQWGWHRQEMSGEKAALRQSCRAVDSQLRWALTVTCRAGTQFDGATETQWGLKRCRVRSLEGQTLTPGSVFRCLPDSAVGMSTWTGSDTSRRPREKSADSPVSSGAGMARKPGRVSCVGS